jgi:hypothetical protein
LTIPPRSHRADSALASDPREDSHSGQAIQELQRRLLRVQPLGREHVNLHEMEPPFVSGWTRSGGSLRTIEKGRRNAGDSQGLEKSTARVFHDAKSSDH